MSGCDTKLMNRLPTPISAISIDEDRAARRRRGCGGATANGALRSASTRGGWRAHVGQRNRAMIDGQHEQGRRDHDIRELGAICASASRSAWVSTVPASAVPDTERPRIR